MVFFPFMPNIVNKKEYCSFVITKVIAMPSLSIPREATIRVHADRLFLCFLSGMLAAVFVFHVLN